MVILNFLRVVKSQLTAHFDIRPLAALMVTTSSVGIGAMIYSAITKSDVVFNRWSKTEPWQRLDPTKPQQKLYAPLDSRSVYQRDPVLEGLRDEIYSDGKYTFA